MSMKRLRAEDVNNLPLKMWKWKIMLWSLVDCDCTVNQGSENAYMCLCSFKKHMRTQQNLPWIETSTGIMCPCTFTNQYKLRFPFFPFEVISEHWCSGLHIVESQPTGPLLSVHLALLLIAASPADERGPRVEWGRQKSAPELAGAPFRLWFGRAFQSCSLANPLEASAAVSTVA